REPRHRREIYPGTHDGARSLSVADGWLCERAPEEREGDNRGNRTAKHQLGSARPLHELPPVHAGSGSANRTPDIRLDGARMLSLNLEFTGVSQFERRSKNRHMT